LKDSDFSTRTTPLNSVVDKKLEIHWESAVKNHLHNKENKVSCGVWLGEALIKLWVII